MSAGTHYFSFGEQTLHYFDRPHEQALGTPLDCDAAWRGAELPGLDQLAYVLNETETEEIMAAVAMLNWQRWRSVTHPTTIAKLMRLGMDWPRSTSTLRRIRCRLFITG